MGEKGHELFEFFLLLVLVLWGPPPCFARLRDSGLQFGIATRGGEPCSCDELQADVSIEGAIAALLGKSEQIEASMNC